MAVDINKLVIHYEYANLLRKLPKIFKKHVDILIHKKGQYTFYEIFSNNDESMGTPSGSIIATNVNFDQPFDVCRQSFYH